MHLAYTFLKNVYRKDDKRTFYLISKFTAGDKHNLASTIPKMSIRFQVWMMGSHRTVLGMRFIDGVMVLLLYDYEC